MKVRDLLEALRGMDPDAKVKILAIDVDKPVAVDTEIEVESSYTNGVSGASSSIVLTPAQELHGSAYHRLGGRPMMNRRGYRN